MQVIPENNCEMCKFTRFAITSLKFMLFFGSRIFPSNRETQQMNHKIYLTRNTQKSAVNLSFTIILNSGIVNTNSNIESDCKMFFIMRFLGLMSDFWVICNFSFHVKPSLIAYTFFMLKAHLSTEPCQHDMHLKFLIFDSTKENEIWI